MKKYLLLILILFFVPQAMAFVDEEISTTSGVIIVDRTAEGITFQSRYTKGQNFDATVFESRSLLIEMMVIEMPKNMSLFVNQVYAEATLASAYECMDRLTIDTMNDKPEGGNEQYGWWVNENHSYVEEWFIGRFVNTERQAGQYGYCEVGTDMGGLGYLGTILQIDYDFYVKMDNEPYAYKFSFIDNIMFSPDGELIDIEDIEGGNQSAPLSIFGFMIGFATIILVRNKYKSRL
jgi:hypothetical protein